MTFKENIKYYRELKLLTQEQLADAIGVKRNTISNYEKGISEPSFDLLKKIVKILDVSIDGILSESDAHLNAHLNAHLIKKEEQKGDKGNDKGIQKMITQYDNLNDNLTKNKLPSLVNEDFVRYQTQKQSQSTKVNTILVDYKDNKLIPITDIRAAAGNGHIEEGFIDATEAILLPQHLLKRSGTRICIRVKGESMAPTLHDASYLIISLIERSEWPLLKENNVYVVADNDGKVYVKRLKNRFNREKPFIVCQSDSPDKASYPNFNLYADEILSIWYAEWYISAKMPNIHDNFYGKVTQLEDSIESLTEDVQKMQSEIKQLKKSDN